MLSRKEHKSKSNAPNLHNSALSGSRPSVGASSARADESGASSDADGDGDESDEEEDTDVQQDLTAAKAQPLLGTSQSHFSSGANILDFKPPILSSAGGGGHLYAQQLHSPTSSSLEAMHSLSTRTSLHLPSASNGALLSPIALSGTHSIRCTRWIVGLYEKSMSRFSQQVTHSYIWVRRFRFARFQITLWALLTLLRAVEGVEEAAASHKEFLGAPRSVRASSTRLQLEVAAASELEWGSAPEWEWLWAL